MKLANLVKSKYFCYFTYALMVINLLGYVSTGSMECVVIFTLATFACKSCLSKNMCLCIFGGLFVSNIFFGCSKVKEGLCADHDGKPKLCEAEGEGCDYTEKKCVAISEAVEAAAAATEDVEDTADAEEEEGEGFRNRRNRRRAVREAFSTIRRAVRSY